MSEVVLGGDGRAVIHNQRTGQEMACSVPTALENVANSGGIWAHGYKPEGLVAKTPEPVAAPEPVIPLVEEGVLPLPAAEPEPGPVSQSAIDDRLRPVSDEHVHAEPAVHPLDHDANGRKGGSRKALDPERAAIIKALKAAKIKFFAGAPTEKLKTLLPG